MRASRRVTANEGAKERGSEGEREKREERERKRERERTREERGFVCVCVWSKQ